ncbi:MAG: hypothetical protein UT37_C0008G0012 [Parcubacteria group bacterium GW2011_GWA2_39_18]|nr:MAG: hypothetical protein UT37_C0008G0012 [Parcubacteria group bacterium GW2011_GWA2_39_18]
MRITLNLNEKIVRTAHKHPLGVLFKTFPYLLAMVVLLILLSFSLYLNASQNELIFALAPIFRFLISASLIVDWLALITCIMLEYFLTSLILTNERVIKIRQNGIFSKSIFVSDIDRIQDIKVEQNGIIAHFYNFGTIRITTASELGEVFFKEIPDPAAFQKSIFDAVNQHDALSKNDSSALPQNLSSNITHETR